MWCWQYSFSNTQDQQVSAVKARIEGDLKGTMCFGSAVVDELCFCLFFLCWEHKGVTTAFLFHSDPELFVYCCDFSSTAVDLVKVRWGEQQRQVLVLTSWVIGTVVTWPLLVRLTQNMTLSDVSPSFMTWAMWKLITLFPMEPLTL